MFKIKEEWDAREKAGLPKYHAIDQEDIGFKFVQPSSPDAGIQAFLDADYPAMEAAWKETDDVRSCTTFKPIESQQLEELPSVNTIFETPPGYLAWLACDENYFAQFGARFLATIEGPSHLHLMDGDPSYAKEVIEFLKRPIGLTVENPEAGPSYYHSIRFCRLAQMLRTREDPIALMDVDAIANKPIKGLPTAPIGMRLRPGRLEPWNQCNASVVIASPAGQEYFDAVADYIFYFWKKNQLRWQIDQTALFCVWKRLGVTIQTLNEKEVDYDYQDNGIIWCNSGRVKWYDNDPSRQRFIERFKEIDIPSPLVSAHAKREREAERVAYLSCELKGRDLDSRLLIASHLCNLGVVTLLGHFWGINGNTGKSIPGCQLFATANDVQAEAMQKAVTAGHYVIASDSEGLPLANPLQNISSSAVSLCDKFLVDSQAHKEILTKQFGDEKFISTGSPRLEYLANIESQVVDGKPYVLFNTGLGIINSFRGSPQEALKAMSGAMEVTQSEADLMIKTESAVLEMLSPLIRWLAPQTRVVIRPHPTENAQAWRDAFPTIEVIEGSSPHTWINSAQLMIHANSTTGIEAATLGIPSLNLDPIEQWGQKFVIRDYSYTVKTLKEAQNAISLFLNEQAGPIADYNRIAKKLDRDGAAKTAWHIADCLKPAKRLKGPFQWSPVDRGEVHRSKFLVTLGEVSERLKHLHFSGDVKQIDDSTFLIWKQTGR